MTRMGSMFRDATSFNQPLNLWDTSSVTRMGSMFEGATSFNQSLSSWVTSSVTNMSYMFYGATAFNQSLSSWNISNVAVMTSMLNSTALSTANYVVTLIGWSLQIVKPNVSLGASGLAVVDGSAGCGARKLLKDSPNNWIISDSSVCNL